MSGPPRTPADPGGGGTYNAYSYLAAGEDFRRFELAPEFGRVAPYAAGLTAEQEQRSRRLLTDSIVISLHDHPVRYPLRMEETPGYNRTGRQHAAYTGLAASGMTVVFDNMMDGTACVTGNAPWRWDDVVTDLGMRQADLAHLLSLDAARGPGFEPVAYVNGMEIPPRTLRNLRLAGPARLRRRGGTGRHRRKRLPGPASRLGQPLTSLGRARRPAAVPELSDKDFTVEV